MMEESFAIIIAELLVVMLVFAALARLLFVTTVIGLSSFQEGKESGLYQGSQVMIL